MRSPKSLKAVFTFILLSLTASPSGAMARKIELSGGAFNFAAKNSQNRSTKSISGVGAYRIAYLHPFLNHFELDVGYSLLATQTFGGDLSFGFDLGANYFFISTPGDRKTASKSSSVLLQHQWRPYLGVSFNQRNFQSTSGQFAGVGVKLGTEYQFLENLSLLGTARYIMLGGPNQSEATQVEILLGFVVQF